MSLWYFEKDAELETVSNLDLDKRLKELLQVNEPGTFSVILHNDPVNGIDFVVGVIKSVFSYRTGKAVWLMLKAHFNGKSALWSGSYKQAEQKMNQMVAFGPDPNMLDRGAEPLNVSVEKND